MYFKKEKRFPVWSPTCVNAVMRLQLVFEAEPFPAAVALVRLFSCVDAFVAPQRAVVSEAAPAELALERVIAWKHSCVKTPTQRSNEVLTWSLGTTWQGAYVAA